MKTKVTEWENVHFTDYTSFLETNKTFRDGRIPIV